MAKIGSLNFVLLAVAIGCGSNQSTNPIIDPNKKPDLVIIQITYARLPNCFQGYPSGVICGGPRFEFKLQIANIGSADLTEAFYISYSRSNSDFHDQYCSAAIRVNDPPTPLRAGESIQGTFVGLIDDSTSHVRFVINTNDQFDRGVPLPRIDEVSYDNNNYDLAMTW